MEADCLTNQYLLHEGAVTLHVHADGKADPLEVIPVPVNGPRQFDTAFHSSETTVVWEHPGTGQVAYPGKNNIPIPERYARMGYQRKEIRSLREVEKFEREKGVLNERAWFDKGSGRSFDRDGSY